MASTAFQLERVGQIANHVNDLDLSVTFYRDKLGLTLLFQVEHMAFFDLGNTRLMLSDLQEDASLEHPGSVLYFQVADIDGAYAHLTDQSVVFVDEPHFVADEGPPGHLWMSFFKDPDDTLLALMSYKTPDSD